MSSHWPMHKSINHRTQYLICGYIKKVEETSPFKQNAYYNIPHGIGYLCMQYYYIRTIRAIHTFRPHKPKQPGLRANGFISKDFIRSLSAFIVEEEWGKEHGMLYKYLDYLFRCQIFDGQIKQITILDDSKWIVFHTGLQRRSDYEFLYFALHPNINAPIEPPWRPSEGDVTETCFTKTELMNKFDMDEDLLRFLPQRSVFYNDLSELLFDASYEIEVNWDERIRTNKYRLFDELKIERRTPDIDRSKMVMELRPLFEIALNKSVMRAKSNPRLTVAQGFVDTKHYRKRVELLLPLNVEYPKDSNNHHTFAFALRKMKHTKKYMGMALLTKSMAYANARLIGYVDSIWLNASAVTESSVTKPNATTFTNHTYHSYQMLQHSLVSLQYLKDFRPLTPRYNLQELNELVQLRTQCERTISMISISDINSSLSEYSRFYNQLNGLIQRIQCQMAYNN